MRARRAFTLIEMIVVTAVLGVLALASASTFSGVVAQTQDSTTSLSLSNIAAELALALAFHPADVNEEFLASLDIDSEAGHVGVHAAGLRWTTGESTGRDVVSWHSVSAHAVNLAMLSPTGRCARVAVLEAGATDPVEFTTDTCTADPTPPEAPSDGPFEDPSAPVPSPAAGPAAMLVSGDVALSGFVHITGLPIVVSGDLTASGTVAVDSAFVGGSVSCSGHATCGEGPSSAQQFGEVAALGSTPPAPVPTALSLWHTYRGAAILGRLNYAGAWEPGSWFDLCPDGTARLPDGLGPCEGTLVASGETITQWVGFEGWTFEPWSSTWVSRQGHSAGAITYGPAPAWQNPTRHRNPSVFYVHERSARITGSNGGPMTVIVSSSPAGSSGNLDVQGGGTRFEPVLGGLLFVADGDIRLRSSAPYRGWTAAGERLDLGGHTVYEGTLVAGGAPHRTGSLLPAGPAATLAASVWLTGPPSS